MSMRAVQHWPMPNLQWFASVVLTMPTCHAHALRYSGVSLLRFAFPVRLFHLEDAAFLVICYQSIAHSFGNAVTSEASRSLQITPIVVSLFCLDSGKMLLLLMHGRLAEASFWRCIASLQLKLSRIACGWGKSSRFFQSIGWRTVLAGRAAKR